MLNALEKPSRLFFVANYNDKATIGSMRAMSIGKVWLNVREAAAILKLSEGRIRQMLTRDQLAGEKLSARAWAIHRDEVARVAKLNRPPGNPTFGGKRATKRRAS
jgi:hypothetical protein